MNDDNNKDKYEYGMNDDNNKDKYEYGMNGNNTYYGQNVQFEPYKRDNSYGPENTYAVACLVCGIASMFTPPIVSTIVAILALVFCSRGRKRGGREYCTIGKIFAIIHLVFVVLVACFVGFCILVYTMTVPAVSSYDYEYEEPSYIERSLDEYEEF